jgi:streptogramin lyase
LPAAVDARFEKERTTLMAPMELKGDARRTLSFFGRFNRGGAALLAALALLGGCTEDDSATSKEQISSKEIQAGTFPRVVVPGGGSMWAVDSDESAVIKIDPESGQAVDLISLEDEGARDLSDITAGGGWLWVTDPTSGQLFKIDSNTGAVVETMKTSGHVGEVYWVAGAIWYEAPHPELKQRGALVRLDPDSLQETAFLTLGNNDAAYAQVIGFDGSVWVVRGNARYIAGGGANPTYFVKAELWEVDQNGKQILRKMPLGSTMTRGAINPVIGDVEVHDDLLWLSWIPEQILVGMDPHTGRIDQKILLEEFDLPWELAVAEGYLWVGNLNESEIARVDTETRDRIVFNVDGGSLSFIGGGFDSIWVPMPGLPEQGGGKVIRIDSAE